MKIENAKNYIFPQKPGIYIFKDSKGIILYIGKAKNLKNRIKQYFTPSSIRKQDMINKSETIEYLITNSETEALQLEENLIKQHKPPFNNLLKDNNHYVYIKFTNEDFPQILIVKKKKNDLAKYIGPKYHNKELKNFLQYFRQIFQYRGCKKTQFNQGKICSDYYFGLCKGRCNPNLDPQNINQEKYNLILKKIQNFFEGNTKIIETELTTQINLAIQKQNFERASKLRDMYFHCNKLKEKQNVSIDEKINGYIIKIYIIGQKRVYIVLHFFEGKLIDTIINKQNSLELNLQSLILNFKNEFNISKKLYIQNLGNKNEEIKNYYSTFKITKKILKSLEPLFQNFLNGYIAQTSFKDDNLINDLLQTLQKKYKLKNFPYHIECIDISHFNGDRNSGGLSCMIAGILEKKYYRRYKIEQNNDYNSLKELLIRRANNKIYPDLLVIDGGKGQLNILKKLYKIKNKELQRFLEYTEFISLGKGEARTTKGKQSGKTEIIYKTNSEFKIKKFLLNYDQTDQLLIKLRNEAHRFANNYRKKQMSKDRK